MAWKKQPGRIQKAILRILGDETEGCTYTELEIRVRAGCSNNFRRAIYALLNEGMIKKNERIITITEKGKEALR